MGNEALLSRFPQEFVVGTSPHATRYVIVPDHYAVLQTVTTPLEEAEFELEDGRVKVIRGTPPLELLESAPQAITAVFRIGKHGWFAVPTGQVFVRLASGSSLTDYRDDIAEAGFRIKETLSYAPQAGWLEAESRLPVDALTGLARLQEIDGVEAVEPQMLTAASRRK